MISGLVIVRLLTTQEYGLYTLALTMLGTMNVLADSGVSAGVMAEGGKVWKDRARLGYVLATGISLRRKFAIYSLVIVLPVLVYMLYRHHATWFQIATIIAGVTLTFHTTLSATILQIVPQLHQQLLDISRIQSKQSVGRLALILGAIRLFPSASVAIFASAIPQLWANRKLQKLSAKFVATNYTTLPEVRENILHLVRRSLPGSVFFCFSGQITLWLIAFMGSIHSIAEIGALGRFSQVSVIYTVIVGSVFMPRIARLPPNAQTLRKWSISVFLLTLVVGGLFVWISAAFSKQLLWMLGESYGGLKVELILSVAGCSLGFISVVVNNIGLARGQIMNPIIWIALMLIGQIVVIPFVDFTTVRGILLFGLIAKIIPLLGRIYYLRNLFIKGTVS